MLTSPFLIIWRETLGQLQTSMANLHFLELLTQWFLTLSDFSADSETATAGFSGGRENREISGFFHWTEDVWKNRRKNNEIIQIL